MSTFAATVITDLKLIKHQRLMLLASMAVLLIIYLVGAYSNILQGKLLLAWTDLAWTLAALAAGLKCLQTARKRISRQERIAWILFGLAALSWFIGMLIWDYYELIVGRIVPFPAASDYFYLGYAPLFLLGLIYYRRPVPSRHYTMIQLSNLGLIISTIIVLCYILLAQAIQQSENSFAYELYAISHSIATIVCFVFGVYCYWFYIWHSNQWTFQLLLISLALFAITDTLYGFELLGQSFDVSSYLNVFWLLAFAFQYWAAFEQNYSDQDYPENDLDNRKLREKRFEAIMPALCLLAVLFFALYYRQQLDESFFIVVVFATIAFAFFLFMREWYTNSLEEALANEIKNANMQLEQRVEQRTVELSRANNELESFSYSVSHDLRAPLRSIKGWTQALREDYHNVLDDTANNYIDRVANNANRMSEIIDDILTLSRINKTKLNIRSISLSALILSIIDHLHEQSPQHHVNITIEEEVIVKADEQLLRVALENLLANSWKYTRDSENPSIEFGVIRENKRCIYYLRDNGVGFDMDFANKLFQPFERLHGNEYEGTGIGLATVQRCIHLHGGKIWGESILGQGATFFFTLP